MTKIYLISSKTIRELRMRRGYSVNQLAEAADISTKYLYDIEAGKKAFSAKVLFNIANALNVSCDFILSGNDNYEIETIIKIIHKLDKLERRYLELILLKIVQIKSDK